MEPFCRRGIVLVAETQDEERVMGFGRGALLWLIGIPIPIILLIAIFIHH
jgi:hypothetical protein